MIGEDIHVSCSAGLMWEEDGCEPHQLVHNGSPFGWLEKPTTAKSPQSAKSENKTLKRKLFSPGNNSHSEDEGVQDGLHGDKKTTPKRRRSLAAGEGSPTPGCTGGTTPKTPGGTPRFVVPLSERQQMALLMQMTAEESQHTGETSPRPSSPHSVGKRTPLDKKVNKRNERGETSLHVAAIKGNVKQTKRLIKAGADVNIKDYAGWTPLHEACNHGWLDVARQLLRAGANVNVQGYGNDTPLHDAAINGHQKLVELLLRHGANPLQVNSKGKAPLDVAANDTITRLLRNEIIASSSSSSSTDDIRSPTSPESNASDRDEDHRKLDKDHIDLSCSASLISEGLGRPSSLTSHSLELHNTTHPPATYPHSLPPHTLPPGQGHFSHPGLNSHTGINNPTTTAPTHTSSIFKKVTVTHHMDKSSSPRLMLRFQHIKTKEKRGNETPKKSRNDSQYKSYSVTLGTNDYHGPYSPVGSSSSQDSDLYDPQLEITTYGSRRNLNSALQHHTAHPQSKHILQQQHQQRHSPSGDSLFNVIHANNFSARNLDMPTMAMPSKGKVDLVTDGSLPGSQADNQMPTLSQESGPFTPRFEDISDDEDKEEPMDLDPLKLSPAALPVVTAQSCLANIPCSSSSGRLLQGGSNAVSAANSCHPVGPLSSVVGMSHLSVSPRSLHDSTVTHSIPTDSSALNSVSNIASSSCMTKQQDCKPRTKESHLHYHPAISQPSRPIPSTPKMFPPVKCEPQSSSSPPNVKTEPKSPSADPHMSTTSHKEDSKPFLKVDCSEVKTEPDSTKTEIRPSCVKQEDKKPHLKVEKELDVPESSQSPKVEHSVASGKVSPRPDRHWSPKPGKETVVQPLCGAVKPFPKPDSNRTSPKSDRDSPKSDKENRPSSPKVPPLKIIIPANTTASSVGDTQHLKTVMSKPALPYVVNPSHDGVPHSTTGNAIEQIENSPLRTFTQHTPSTTVPSEPGDLKIDLKENDTCVPSSEAMSNSVMACEAGIEERERRRGRYKHTDRDKDKSPDSLGDSFLDQDKDSGKAEKLEDSNSDKESSKDGSSREGQKQDEPAGERRMTRSAVRSQQLQQQNQGDKDKEEIKNGKVDRDKESDSSSNQGNAGRILRSDSTATLDDIKMHPRKRKLRQRQQQEQMGLDSVPNHQPANHDQQPLPLLTQQPEKPGNPFEMYLNIRKKVASRHSQWLAVVPKPPQGFKDYLMVSCNYVLEGNSASRLSVPMLTPPNSLTGPMRDLFVEQERSRYNLRLQHVIQRDKLRLSTEQETLRVHARAARAMANQSMPLSACSILRDEDIYNPLDVEAEERDKNTRQRFNGRQLLSWLQDVDDKFEKLKESLLLRHHHEAESLHAFQLLEWEWRMKELSLCEARSRPSLDELNVPLVHISDELDLLPP